MKSNLELVNSSLFTDLRDTEAEQISGGLSLSFEVEISGKPKEIAEFLKKWKKKKEKK